MLNIDDRLIKEISPKIKPNALSVLLAISIHLNKSNGTCFPSHQRLMQLTGMTRGSVYAAMEVLKKNGLLKTEQSIDTKAKTFGRRTFRVTTKLIKVFVDAEDMEPLPVSPYTAPPDTVQPHTVESETQLLNQSEQINQLEQLNKEGERTPTAPNPSNLQSQKNESGLVAPPGFGNFDHFSGFGLDYLKTPETVKAENPPSPNSTPPPSPLKLGFCGKCMGLGYRNGRNGRETCEDCEGSGHGDQKIDARKFEVTAIASPTELPGVTLVEAAPIHHRKNGRIEIPDEAAAEILPWVKGDGAQTVKSWYDRAFRQHSPKDVEDMVMRFSTVFLSSEKAAFRDMMETNPLSFFKRRFAGFVADQKQYDRNNAPKEGGQTRQNGQPEKTLISNMRQL